MTKRATTSHRRSSEYSLHIDH